MPEEKFQPTPDILAAGRTNIGNLFAQQVRAKPNVVALACGSIQRTYAELNERINRMANALTGMGLTSGDRLALISRNRAEYLEIQLAAAKIGVIAACINWRLVGEELIYCIELVSPELVILQDVYAKVLSEAEYSLPDHLVLGSDYENTLASSSPAEPNVAVSPEDGFLILYTSGTTGLPKAAVISHRAMIARAMTGGTEVLLPFDDTFAAWTPLCHMGSTDPSVGTLLRGGKVLVINGYDEEALLDAVAKEKIGWFIAVPGMTANFIAALKRTETKVKGVGVVGVMPDLVPRQQIAEITTLLDAPYLNSFGSTEVGFPPATGRLIPVGTTPESMSKRQSSFCELRLIKLDGCEADIGEPGVLEVRGPTLFSGYWQAEETNAADFNNGWFRTGDMLRRNADGTLDFVDRAKYMIKTGGENVYPAEIEQVLLSAAEIEDAAVVRQADEKWGEIPIAFVVPASDDLTADRVLQLCKQKLAGFKCPKVIHFIETGDVPRSANGKIKRHELEARLG